MQTHNSPKLMKSTNERKRKHITNAVFTRLVMSATWEMNCECKKFYSCLTEMICKKRKNNYNVTITWIRRKIAFTLIKAVGICIRRSRSVFQNDNLEMSLRGGASTSEFQTSMQISKITYDTRHRSKNSIFVTIIDNCKVLAAAYKLAANKKGVN